jgi:5-histidylcysteine sulfoxide synthase/putative 4-mercaptohistidine N1-methyltranferase
MTAENALKKYASMESSYMRTPLLDGGNAADKRQEIADYFNFTFERYESLFDTLIDDQAYFQKSIPLRHPLIFYFGHTATFFVNKMLLAGLIDKRIDPKFESMFAVGVDEMSWDDLNEDHYDWPAVEEVKAYRKKVQAMVNKVIRQAPLKLPIDWENPWWSIMMGIEHEQIHLETSSVLIRQQRLEWVKPHPAWQPFRETNEAPKNSLVDIPAGSVSLGKPYSDPIYGWDNEYGVHEADVEAFQAAKFLVSNQEFLEFVEDGGYHTDEFWSEDGLQWRQFTKAQHPTFWLQTKKGWQCRLMAEVIDMPWDWPVDVNYHEAKAFCNWKAKQTGQSVRLPTEDEWYRLYEVAGLDELTSDLAPANIHLDYAASSCPVNFFKHGDLYDVIGNVWQWTETPIYPFDEFKVHPIYDDFTTPTFDGRHNLIKGGSWISSGNESRKASRYAFRKHFFQHAGFRYVVSEAELEEYSSNYETDIMLSQYAEFHYGDEYFNVVNFPKKLAELAVEMMAGRPMTKALDLGCSVGRASFELARHFDQVTGIDFSARLINLGTQMAEQGVVRYTITDEGELVHYKERRLDQLDLEDTASKVEFLQGDACNLKPMFAGYDLILAANLIDRLYKPAQFLATVHERLNQQGLLVLASPYTWLDEHTEKEHWLGGFKKDGESFTTLDGLKAILEPHFELIRGPEDIPFVIRETSRKFQHTLSEVTHWKRK